MTGKVKASPLAGGGEARQIGPLKRLARKVMRYFHRMEYSMGLTAHAGMLQVQGFSSSFHLSFFFPFFAGLFLVKLEVKSSPHHQPPRQHGLPVPPHSTPTPRRLHHQVDRNSIPMQACTLGTHSSLTTHLNRQLSLAPLSQTSPGLLNVHVHNFCIPSWIHVYDTLSNMHMCYYAPYAAFLNVPSAHSIR